MFRFGCDRQRKTKDFSKNFRKPVDRLAFDRYNTSCAFACAFGSIAQLGEHLPYKQRVTGSSPVVPTKFGPVVQLVRMPACHAGGRGFEPHPDRQSFCRGSLLGFLYIKQISRLYASVAQSVEQRTENPCVGGSSPL